MSDPFIKNNLPDYTEEEFVSFIDEIRKEDKASTDDRADELVLHLNKIAGHPGGMDLIYYPELGADTSSAGIVKTIKEWRAAHGLPGFKE
ncbi:bacteriocin immunity protein [Pseudomonas sp. MAFF 730085]|uniref:Bacteriocin immunity protein n=1 Tax=Pseudomonas kitaguniensis TaxID=2607908 RepID=A0A5N7JQ83_9PSED|nr:bacteriocin immunity protein [Pseudomonas kitaguniensis]MPQ83564.1 bacteriocin immunity protein [Pseudomonas kitaguniensis]